MKEYTISTKKANIIGIIAAIPTSALMSFLFRSIWNNSSMEGIRELKKMLASTGNDLVDTVFTVTAPVVLIAMGAILHELIHGAAMFAFTKNIHTIKFGFKLKALLPYAHCKQPLTVAQMLVVSLSPWAVLGLTPFLISLATGNVVLCFFGVTMTLVAVGDFIYSWLLVNSGHNCQMLDHESKIGFYLVDGDAATSDTH